MIEPVTVCKACERPEPNIPLRGRYANLCSACRQSKARAEAIGDMPPGPERGKVILQPVLGPAGLKASLENIAPAARSVARERAAIEPAVVGTYEERAMVLIDAARDLDAARDRYNAALRACAGKKAS